MIGLRRRQILGIVLALFLVLAPTIATPALAQSKQFFIGSFGGAPVLGHEAS